MFSLKVERWRPLLKEHADGMPVEFLGAWVAMESGGDSMSTGAATEVGIFQIDMQDGPRYGGSVASLHKPYDSLGDDGKLLQVTSGVAMVKDYAAKSTQRLSEVESNWPRGSSDFWCLVKLHHALPAIPYYFLRAFLKAKGRGPSTWDEWVGWMNALTKSEVSAISSAVGAYYGSKGKPALSRFSDNAENAGRYGGVELLGGLVTMTTIALALFAFALALATRLA